MFFFFAYFFFSFSLLMHAYSLVYLDLIADKATNCSCFRLSKFRRKARTRRSASMGVLLAVTDVAFSVMSDSGVEVSVAGSHLAHSSLSEYWSRMALTWLTV